MRTLTVLAFSTLLLASAGLANGQDYVSECKQSVARQANTSPDAISAKLGPLLSNGIRVVSWEAKWGNRPSGYCEFNTAEGSLVRTMAGRFDRAVANTIEQEQPGGFGNAPDIDAPDVSVDTDGEGKYSGPDHSVEIERGWVNTQGQTTVALSGEDNFKINFYGKIVRQNTEREYTLQITGSDRGDASGTGTFRLNDDENEVEYIRVEGRLKGQAFSGNFQRD